jgi:malate dehydrogenase
MRSARVLAQTWKAVSESAAEFSTRAGKERKVAVLGAAGGIGQPLSLLMKVGAYCSWASRVARALRQT